MRISEKRFVVGSFAIQPAVNSEEFFSGCQSTQNSLLHKNIHFCHQETWKEYTTVTGLRCTPLARTGSLLYLPPTAATNTKPIICLLSAYEIPVRLSLPEKRQPAPPDFAQLEPSRRLPHQFPARGGDFRQVRLTCAVATGQRSRDY